MKTKKEFDCVKMKDDAQLQRAEQLRDLSQMERMEFYRREYDALVARKKRLQEASAKS